MLSNVEQKRLNIRYTDLKKKSDLGQFMTPARIARFMVNMFPSSNGSCRLLDAGAGIGTLSIAFIERWKDGGFQFSDMEVDAIEVDPSLHSQLSQSLEEYKHGNNISVNTKRDDFIFVATELLAGNLFANAASSYTHAILNPPYKKITSDSTYRFALRSIGIETVNLYSAFVALSVALASPGGQIVAIIPRSFCNGPYYRPFRDFVLGHTAIHHLHLFESRSKAFKDDEVLQENIILRIERDGLQGPVTITTSTDDSFVDLSIHKLPFERIVLPDDPEKFIHVPTSPEKSTIELSMGVCHTLADLGISVSTGPVVDFRLKEYLRDMPEEGSVPLIYPYHLRNNGAVWPIQNSKKPNAIVCNNVTEKWLYPNGYYCVVRRLSSKEEKRRIVATAVEPSLFENHIMVGFENHVNLFHENKHGLNEHIARGLAVFLNTTAVDEYFRLFNGHTQVNATDLRLMKYPSREVLTELGKWAKHCGEITQDMIDEQLGKMIA